MKDQVHYSTGSDRIPFFPGLLQYSISAGKPLFQHPSPFVFGFFLILIFRTILWSPKILSAPLESREQLLCNATVPSDKAARNAWLAWPCSDTVLQLLPEVRHQKTCSQLSGPIFLQGSNLSKVCKEQSISMHNQLTSSQVLTVTVLFVLYHQQ